MDHFYMEPDNSQQMDHKELHGIHDDNVLPGRLLAQ